MSQVKIQIENTEAKSWRFVRGQVWDEPKKLKTRAKIEISLINLVGWGLF